MLPGDVPCNAECHNTHCRYCAFGMCMDNASCEERLPRPKSEGDNEKEDDDD